MKNKLGYLFLSTLMLVGCNGNKQSNNSSENKPNSSTTIKDVTDEQLRTTEENFVIYDNKMTMEAINGSRETPDPFIYRFNGWYYLYPTTNGGALASIPELSGMYMNIPATRRLRNSLLSINQV